MLYISTRGKVKPIPFDQTVLMGMGTDGGLMMPEEFPQVDEATLNRWNLLSYEDLAYEIIRIYVGESIPAGILRDIIRESYKNFFHRKISPVVQLGKLSLVELFHGPTLAFKDISLQFLGNIFEYLLKRDRHSLNILGATSGDTGSAAIYGIKGKKNIRIFIIHPDNKISRVQKLQMTNVSDKNVFNIAVRGNFDDGQAIIKEIFSDLDFKTRYCLGSINSINWARVAAQIVYYFYSYFRTVKRIGEEVIFSVPTGNFGDIFAGYGAKEMGLPIRKLLLATNQNNILCRFVNGGEYKTGKLLPSISPSMDIQVASNFERYLFCLFGGDAEKICRVFEKFKKTGAITVTPGELRQVQSDFLSVAVSEEETISEIRGIFEETGYIVDPHTAVGLRAARRKNIHSCPVICLATAHPAKFGEAVKKAIGKPPPVPQRLAKMLEGKSRYTVLNADAEEVKNFLKSNPG